MKLVDGSENYLVLFDYDFQLSGYLIFSVFLIAITYTLAIILKLFKESFLSNNFIAYFIKTFPIFPIVAGITWFSLDLLFPKDKYDFLTLGLDFASANMSFFPNASTMTNIQFIIIGESLSYGLGFYTTILMLIVLLGHQIFFITKFDKLFGLDEN